MRKLFLYILFAYSTIGFCQDSQIKKADKYFQIAAYEKAAEAYSEILEENKSPKILRKAADSYYFTSNFEKALPLYKEIVEANKKNADEKYIFRYAQTLKALGEVKESNKWMKLYEKEMTETVYKANLDKLENIKKQGNKFEINTVPINTENSEFGPYVYNDFLYFASPKKKTGLFEKDYNWTNQPYLDIYKVAIKENQVDSIIVPLSENINSKFHEADIAITNDGKTMYFTRNNSEEGKKRKKDKNKTTHLGIYKAELVGEEWTNIKPLSINGIEYSVMHPMLNKDNSKLYFSSDMPGTNGSFDIFYVTLDSNGNLGKPTNLGSTINTKNREQFPFVNDNEDIFFSSDGQPGYGLLDVFVSRKKEDGYTTPLNVGLPINTNRDDFAFIINDQTKKGFFSSNRLDGKGDDDIYSATQIAPLEDFQYFVQGSVIDNEKEEPIEGALVTLYDENDNKIGEMEVGNKAAFYFDLKPGTYKLISTHPKYIQAEKTFTVLDNGNPKTEQIMKMQRIPTTFLEDLIAEEGEPRVITDNGVLMFDLPEILFDLDKFNIREDAQVHLNKLIDKLTRYPKVKIEIGSHTDIRGTDKYNETLSQNRASATRDYIIKGGISEDRITAMGYGETKPKVDCIDHECSEAEHQINRRSEFIIIVDKKDLE